MAPRKSERLINLLIALLSTSRYLSKHEIRHLIEDYRETVNDQAFERAFERDKDELRSLGIVISTGSNDPLLEEEDGYRIDRADFELPALNFTQDELAALGIASQVWQGSVAATHTVQAFEALRAAGAAPDLGKIPSVRPQLGTEPDFDVVYTAVTERRLLSFGYKDQQRRLEPWKLIYRGGHWYVFGYDQDRQAERRFKLSRFTTPAKAGAKSGAYDVPDDMEARAASALPEFLAQAVIALRDGASHPWRVHGQLAAETAPKGYTAYQVAASSEEILLDEVLAAGPDVVLLAPAELREKVIARLKGSAAL